jgi:hypothetical protein
MKKFGMLVVGFVIGATLTLSPQIYGAGSKLLGSKVDNTLDIKLNGSSIGQGAVINGTSYIPVRSAANALGLEVNVDNTQVNLTETSNEDNARIAQEEQAKMDKEQKENDDAAYKDKLNRDITSSKRKLESYTKALTLSESEIVRTKAMLDTINANPQAPADSIKEAQDKYNTALSAKEAMQKKINDETKVLSDLQTELSKMQQ